MSNQSFSFNSVDFGTATYGVRVLAVPGSGTSWMQTPGSRRISIPLGRNDGNLSSPVTWGARDFSMLCEIVASSFSTLQSQWRSTLQRLNRDVEKELVVDAFNDRIYDAVFTGADVSYLGPQVIRFTANFQMDDPFGRASSYTTENDTKTTAIGSGESFSFTTAGSAKTYPIITIVPTAVDANGIVIETNLTGARLFWTGTWSASDSLVINCDPRVWTITLNGTSVLQYLSSAGGFPVLLPGSSDLVFYGFKGAIETKWLDRYLD